MKITRRFTKAGVDVFSTVQYERRTSRITNPDGKVVFEMTDAEIPASWSQLATDIMVSKYFRKAGVPQFNPDGTPMLDESGKPVLGPERSARQVIHRLAGCWRMWGEKHGYFDTPEDAQAFYDELVYMMLHQMCAPNSPQWFNTGLHFAYGITGPAQGHHYCEPSTGEVKLSPDAYSRPQPHACFIQSVEDDLVNPGGIMDLWVREARLFKYGSGTGTNFSRLRGENEPLSGGGKSSGLMSFLKIGDRAAGAIKSGGTTRRAAKMVCLDLDHPDIEAFINWKVREELKVACLVEGLKHIPADQRELARRLGLRLDYDFNGEAYYTVSGQNSNNSVRIPNRFFTALEKDGDWPLTWRTNGKVCKTVKARDLWEQIAYAAWRCADPGVQFDDTINQWHTCPRSGRINASNPCVTGDTRVLTPGGVWRRIDSMIHLPSRIVTNLAGQEIHATEGAFPTGQRDVYELRTASGYTLRLTADHRVWVRKRAAAHDAPSSGGEGAWVEARDLLPGDEVCLPGRPAWDHAATAATHAAIADPADPMFFQLVGLFLADRNGDVEALHLDGLLDEPAMSQLKAYAATVWGHGADGELPSGQGEPSGANDAADGGDGVDGAGGSVAVLTSRRLLSRIRACVRLDADGLPRLGDEAFTAGLAAQKHLLRALFSADATLEGGELVLRSASAGLLADVQLVLLGFGVKSAVSVRDDGTAVLTVAGRSLTAFRRHVSLLPGRKLEALQAMSLPPESSDTHTDPVVSVTYAGRESVFDLTEPVTSSFVANGLTVHNCSEYMFLDDTACNLASLNVLTFYDAESRRFDLAAYRHAIRLWTIVLEISVLMASFPSEAIARLSYRFRTLGLGYANLGAMLMQAGIPYDSPRGRAICAALTAVLTGEAYATSAEMARELGPFPGYAENQADMLRVIRNHRRAAYGSRHPALGNAGAYEGLDITPVEIDESQFGADTLASRELLAAARECWDRALLLGSKHGYRNAQTTVIAPTGTIGLLMDCDTTGVEPDFALVKFKKLAGGGYFKIANQSLAPALRSLGYSPSQIGDILDYVLGTMSLENAPFINRQSLLAKGLTDADIDKIEKSLPGMFELSFAFTPWTLGPEAMQRLGITEAEYMAPGFNLLRKLGFTRRQINAANDVICGRGTVEGAPHLKEEHYPVFDCANKCGKSGKRYIAPEGHIRMMAAAQPFISGAISKTINLPHEATVEDIKTCYRLSWELGLKANALYRDGSKLSQPLNIKSDDDLDKAEEDDELNVAAAKEALAEDTAKAVAEVIARAASPEPTATARNGDGGTHADTSAPGEHVRVIERVVERIVERPLRRRLNDERQAINHKFDVNGHEGYISVGLYEDGTPGEVFITMAKEGSTIGGLMDTIATLVSVALQYGVPIETLVRKFEHVRFEPNGTTRNRHIPFAKSLVDYIFRWLGMKFIPGYLEANSPVYAAGDAAAAPPAVLPPRGATPPTPAPASTAAAEAKAHDAGPLFASSPATSAARLARPVAIPGQLSGRQLSPLDQQGSELQKDAPACDVCGSITVRSGNCYKCRNCGNSMGCS
ncbi:MAG: LAGLIDADG family homing endonuclease [Tepidisphaerales bacterium]